MAEQKTNVMRVLEQKNINTRRTAPARRRCRGRASVAAALGVDAAKIFKTLVTAAQRDIRL